MNRFSIATLCAVLVIVGHVFDRTTGQGLPHVVVELGDARATTDANGRFSIRGAKRGTTTVTVKSADVPSQHFAIHVEAGTTHLDLHVCSTTLDYNCGAPALHDSGGSGSAG